MDHRDQLGLRVPLDPKVRLDLQVLRVLLFKETLAQLDTLDHPDLLVSLASRVVLGHWVQLALQDHLVFQDLWDPLELLDPRVALVLRDHWVHWDRPDKLDLLEIKARTGISLLILEYCSLLLMLQQCKLYAINRHISKSLKNLNRIDDFNNNYNNNDNDNKVQIGL